MELGNICSVLLLRQESLQLLIPEIRMTAINLPHWGSIHALGLHTSFLQEKEDFLQVLRG